MKHASSVFCRAAWQINSVGWAGIGVASLGILGELEEKANHGKAPKKAEKKST